MQVYKFPKAKLNVSEYTKPSIGRDKPMLLDETISGLVSKYNLHNSVYQGAFGRYMCTSVTQLPRASNIFGLYMKAISGLSEILSNIAIRAGLNLIGWTLFDAQDGSCRLQMAVCNRRYSRVDKDAPYILLSRLTHRVEVPNGANFYEGYLESIVGHIKELLWSLGNLSLPIDLLEVSFFGSSRSEESYIEEDEGTPKWHPMGTVNNTSLVLSGLSLISKKNGFSGFRVLEGKYAMVVVL